MRISQLSHKTTFIAIILIIILGFAVYGNSLDGEFIWDDYDLVKDNAYIKNWSNIPKIFAITKDYTVYAYYRPLQLLTYMADYYFWGLKVQGYHLTNILLHILVALGVYWLVNLLYGDKVLSLIASLFFVVHPLHTAAVTYISGRADSMAALFMLLTFILYIKHLNLNSVSFYALMLLSYILALLSKESSLILPVLILLYHYSFSARLKIKKFMPILGITFIYILLRLTILKSLLPDPLFPTTLFQRILGFFAAITNYTRLLILPFDLHMEYGIVLFGLKNLVVILGAVILLLLLACAFRTRNSNRLVFFSISWFFIALLPHSNIYSLNAYMAEHWLYLPSIGFFVILAKGLSYIYRSRNLKIFGIVFIIALLAFYSYLTVRQNNYWKDPIIFYRRTLKYSSHIPRMHNNLGISYSAVGKHKEAIASYKKAVEINPNLLAAHYNLGNAYNATGEYEKAVVSYKKVIEIDPDYAAAYNNLAATYYYEKKYDLAIKYCDRAIKLGHKVHSGFLKTLEKYRKP